MFIQNKISPFIKTYWDKICDVKKLIQESDRIIIGAGAGLSASGGISYTDKELFKKWFHMYCGKGYQTIIDMQSMFWDVNDENVTSYWAYWARHISKIFYEAPALKPYNDLFEIVKDKDYFICSTNVDGQFEKAGFPSDKIYGPQGSYSLFQCSKPCTDEVYDNKKMVDNMLANMNDDDVHIREEDIPRCPRCGRLLVPNLRKDDTFVQKPHMINTNVFQKYINESKGKKLVLLELGVGYNTPVIIRYPFENITEQYEYARLIRINMSYWEVPSKIAQKSIEINNDISKVLQDIL
ncbi:NAD-dependent protein deacetylase, SIR2 family [Clostridium estertheticum]|uniref:SIR2 family NAD-dependent protein deacylase n=1 Tax=Clostridium estertheticum TaxID=238834 RepID=UPI001C0E0706|nr:NAD-dependent protein deacetylase, SIR2 family [Clostridium estertheticum]MBU3201308.1 NAD-dependent protein deacetylase, SIR2 family [Clostridium estertheticum]WAG66686.1 NAD-dependent protein deacetylase, SIR2 family [Clostridium estertheticum]